MTDSALRRARSIVLFVGGMAGTVYEVAINQTERPTIIILLAGMMGLPLFLGKKPDPPPKEDKS